MPKDSLTPTASGIMVAVLCRALARRSRDWHGILRECGLEENLPQLAHQRIDLLQLADVYGLASSRYRDRSLGLLAGQQLQLHDLYALGVVMRFSDSMLEACEALGHHFDWLLEGLHLSVESQPPQLHITLRAAPLQLYRGALMDWLMAGIAQLVGQLGSRRITPLMIEMNASHAAAHQWPWPVVTGSKHNRLVYELAPFLALQPQRDRELCRHNQALITRGLQHRSQYHLALRARTCLEQLLLEGQLGEPQLARQMKMGIRTLQRRLKDCDTSYSDLLTQVRKSLAADLLMTTRTPIEEVARQLGFSEPANFSRAFRRWFGTSPSHYRGRQAGPSP
ncbi:AraC family transcriptional regulator [Alcanivorax hongdengensis A-11-3]|uniref:AraC family transcriptional regulator n=1 Tax=Alcanivorax hongdengensis A-11-3 TaxID=1177179 RepID=L0W9Y5_9GAMM|nr:AraC family transcriptional regulator [Alcanivorax hongdengensis]EKF73568.1 AraC family transcriptional regulator [Alcanivorax hongdengensis A-11-3]